MSTDVSIKYRRILKETDKAVLIECAIDTGKPLNTWLPKSLIHIDKDDREVTMSRRLCEQKDLDDFICAT